MKKKICITVLLALAAIFAVSAYLYLSEYLQDKEQTDEFISMAQLVDEHSNSVDLLSKYAQLYEQNNDFIGWINIAGTVIDYPVMQSKDNPDFYLKHNFKKEYSRFGVPYIQGNCTLSSDNIIIYGHNMKTKAMFNELVQYQSEDFCKSHKYIYFDTLSEQRTYEVICAFKTVAYTDSGFQYYEFVNADNTEDFSAYIEKCKALSFYDTGVSAEYGDKLLTLSTCEYSQKNGRFAVVAKLIEVKSYEA